MGRKATGGVTWQKDEAGVFRLHARITERDGSRKPHPIPEDWATKNTPETWAMAQEVATRLSIARRGDVAPIRRDRPATTRETVAEYAKRWLEARTNRTARDNKSHLETHALPLIGPLAMSDVRPEHGDRIVAALDAKVRARELGDKTARNIWGTAKKMFKDAAHAKPATGLRCLEANPFRDVAPPDRMKTKKALQFLYPSEFATLLHCARVPLHFRRNVAIAVYLGLRSGEQRALRWANVDLAHGVVTIAETYDKGTGETRDGTKTGTTRPVLIPAPLLPLLQTMHEEHGGRGLVCQRIGGHASLSRGLRTWLRNAGIVRPQLFDRNDLNHPIRWHDLRATCGTWLAAQGRSATEIRDVLGHTKTTMTDQYMRNATLIRGGNFGQVFAELPAGLISAAFTLSGYRAAKAAESLPKSGADGNRIGRGNHRKPKSVGLFNGGPCAGPVRIHRFAEAGPEGFEPVRADQGRNQQR